LSARKPSPEHVSECGPRAEPEAEGHGRVGEWVGGGLQTDEKDEALCGRRMVGYVMLPHSSHNGAREVGVKDGVDVDQMKNHCHGQEAIATEAGHGGSRRNGASARARADV